MAKRAKDARIEIRLMSGDKAIIRKMAQEAGLDVNDFILSRVWGEAVELASPLPDSPKPNSLESLKARFGMQKASELGACDAHMPHPIQRRQFNSSRPGWYDSVASVEWGGQVFRDRQTGQVWLYVNGRPKEFDNEQAAKNALDAIS